MKGDWTNSWIRKSIASPEIVEVLTYHIADLGKAFKKNGNTEEYYKFLQFFEKHNDKKDIVFVQIIVVRTGEPKFFDRYIVSPLTPIASELN